MFLKNPLSPTDDPVRLLHAIALAGATWQRVEHRYVGEAHLDRESLEAAGRLGALLALRSHDPTRGANFRTHVINTVRHAIQEEARRQDYLSRALREHARRETVCVEEPPAWARPPLDLDAPMGEGLDSWRECLCGEGNPEALALARLEAAELCAAVARLPERERFIIRRVYWDGDTRHACAAPLGVCKARAVQLHRQALGRLRERMEP